VREVRSTLTTFSNSSVERWRRIGAVEGAEGPGQL
jgi:hypothetical protein